MLGKIAFMMRTWNEELEIAPETNPKNYLGLTAKTTFI